MNANTVLLGWGFVAILCLPGGSWAETPVSDESRRLESEVRTVFQAKCTPCHGPNVARPKAGFGYVLDLKRVASNPDMIVPSKPEESDLWAMVESGEMPAPDSPTGPLTAAQKASIRAWIVAGAPVAAPSPTDGAAKTDETGGASEPSFFTRLVRLVGKFHLLLLHFPIVLVIVAGGTEAWSAWKGNRGLAQTVRFCLWLSAGAALLTGSLGWLYAFAGHGAKSPDLLLFHRWLGTTTVVCTIATAILFERTVRRERSPWWVRGMIFGDVLLVSVVGHLGGLMAHGARFFNW